MNPESRVWLLRFPYILYMAMTTLGAPASPARERAFKAVLTTLETDTGLLGESLREGRQQAEQGPLLKDFVKALSQGQTNLAQGILSCIEVINNELPESDGERFKQMAFEITDTIAQHTRVPADHEKDRQFIKNLRGWFAMM